MTAHVFHDRWHAPRRGSGDEITGISHIEKGPFLRDYMSEFRDHVERVLTVLPRS